MSSNSNNNANGSSGLSGFLWGAIIGAGIVFFLTTKSGKKLLRKIKEEGLDGVSEITDFIENEVEDIDEEVDFSSDAGSGSRPPNHEKKKEGNGSAVDKVATSARRFFKGIPKRSH